MDKNKNIFIIEVKSLLKSNGKNNMSEYASKEYEEKIEKLKDAYKATSKKLPYYFCIILKEPNG
jgi:hypothetical protein